MDMEDGLQQKMCLQRCIALEAWTVRRGLPHIRARCQGTGAVRVPRPASAVHTCASLFCALCESVLLSSSKSVLLSCSNSPSWPSRSRGLVSQACSRLCGDFFVWSHLRLCFISCTVSLLYVPALERLHCHWATSTGRRGLQRNDMIATHQHTLHGAPSEVFDHRLNRCSRPSASIRAPTRNNNVRTGTGTGRGRAMQISSWRPWQCCLAVLLAVPVLAGASQCKLDCNWIVEPVGSVRMRRVPPSFREFLDSRSPRPRGRAAAKLFATCSQSCLRDTSGLNLLLLLVQPPSLFAPSRKRCARAPGARRVRLPCNLSEIFSMMAAMSDDVL